MNATTGFSTIGLIGAGELGAGIAAQLSAAGCRVLALETDGLDPATVTAVESLSAYAGVDAVIETVADDLPTKARALGEAAAAVADGVPLFTTTSTLSVTEIAASLANPARVAGLHFFGSAADHATVEVVRAVQTDDELVDRAVELIGSLAEKTPVVVPDRPGFLIDAMLMPYLNDVIAEFDDGLATAEDIDVALELGLGYRTGPLAMLDRIGLDNHLRATEAVYAATGDSRYAPPPLLRRMVAAGHLGDASGRGFRTQSTKGN